MESRGRESLEERRVLGEGEGEPGVRSVHSSLRGKRSGYSRFRYKEKEGTRRNTDSKGAIRKEDQKGERNSVRRERDGEHEARGSFNIPRYAGDVILT